MKALTKSQNRLISFIAIAIFFVALLLVTFFSISVYNNYQENLALKQEQIALEKELAYQNHLSASIDENGVYVVYASSEEVIYGQEIIIIG